MKLVIAVLVLSIASLVIVLFIKWGSFVPDSICSGFLVAVSIRHYAGHFFSSDYDNLLVWGSIAIMLVIRLLVPGLSFYLVYLAVSTWAAAASGQTAIVLAVSAVILFICFFTFRFHPIVALFVIMSGVLLSITIVSCASTFWVKHGKGWHDISDTLVYQSNPVVDVVVVLFAVLLSFLLFFRLTPGTKYEKLPVSN